MELINTRIIKLRNHLGMNQSQFARKLGVTSTLINKIEAMKSPLTDINIRLICFTFGVREARLRDGEGDMMDNEALLSDQERQLLDLFRRLSPRARILAIEYLEKLVSDEAALRGGTEAAQNAPEGATRPLEAPHGAKPEESTGIHPIHDKNRG
jgi:transcriptional regulator with XRE-family HTH domain